MPSSGSGTGTPISGGAPTASVGCPNLLNTFLTLEEYWDFLQINECAGYGIRRYPTTGVLGLGCGDFWNQTNRYFLTAAIQKVESRMESDRWLGFPIKRKYYSARQLDYSFPTNLGKWVRGVGVETNTLVQAAKTFALSTGGTINDPVEFTVNVTFTDIDELVICYPGATPNSSTSKINCEIHPSSITISGGVATIQIPRCRLLRPEFFKDYANDNERPDYTDDDYFLDNVDIYRNYLDETTGTNLVWWRHQGQLCCLNGVEVCEPTASCSDVLQLACPYIQNERFGDVQFEPASYSDGWTKQQYAVRRKPDGLQVSYMRGFHDRYDYIRADLKRAIIAWAHNNMPQDYCSCSVQTHYYKMDTQPVEPAVRMGSGRSTWGNLEAEQIIREFDKDRVSYAGGLM